MIFSNEVNSEEFKQKKNKLMKEQTNLTDLLNDAQTGINIWLERVEKLLCFAEATKQCFETGSLQEKKEILQALGWNLFLKDRIVSI